MVGFKTSVVKHREKVDFLPHVVATTPQDRSSCCRISRYGESSFPRMRTASLLDFFTSGHRSRGHHSDLLKVPKEDISPTPPLPHSPSFSFSLAVSSLFLALYPVYRLFSARPYSQWNFSLVNKLSLHATQSHLSVLSRYFYVTLNLVAVKTV